MSGLDCQQNKTLYIFNRIKGKCKIVPVLF